MKDLAEPLIKLLDELDPDDDESVLYFAMKAKMLFSEKYDALFLKTINTTQGKEVKAPGVDDVLPLRLGFIIPYLHQNKEKGDLLFKKLETLRKKTNDFADFYPMTPKEIGVVSGVAEMFGVAKAFDFNFPDETPGEKETIPVIGKQMRDLSELQEISEEVVRLEKATGKSHIKSDSIDALSTLHKKLLLEITEEQVKRKESKLENRLHQCENPANEFIELVMNIAKKEVNRLNTSKTDILYASDYKLSRKSTREKFDRLLKTFEGLQKEAKGIFDVSALPKKESLSNGEYFVLLQKHREEKNREIILLSEKMHSAVQMLSNDLDEIEPHKKGLTRLDTPIIYGLIKLFEVLHANWPTIPKLPGFLKTKSQEELEKIKKTTHDVLEKIRNKKR